VLEKARSSIDAGCRVLKLKIQSRPVSESVSLARELAALHPDVALRLDANRSLDFDTAASLWKQTRGLPIEYFEEPLHDASRLPELIQKTGAPVALDETLRQISPDGLSLFLGARALVLKPTLLGTPSECVRWAEAGAALGMRSVVSAAYESGVGIHALARIAAALPAPSAAGLDTYSALFEDTLATRLDLAQWVVDLKQPRPPLRADFAKCAP
jgi:O-succinylbenzoate synthase